MRLIDVDAFKTEHRMADMCGDCKRTKRELDCNVCDCCDWLDNAPTVDQWISVEERLPDDASDVLAYYDCGDDSRVMFVNYYKRCWYDSVFNDLIDDLDQGCITHWMPLPEPPKGVKQDD